MNPEHPNTAHALIGNVNGRPGTPAWSTAVDQAAIRDFVQRHGSPDFGPVTVVIAAYEEAANIGAVIDRVPKAVAGMPVSSLVVVDGGDDGTEDIVARHGAYACVAPVNRGQGAALRLGYRIAASQGAELLVTVDADGQYDPRELPVLLDPILHDEADFVSGSRRMSSSHATDKLRAAGVVLFAAVITALTRTRVTDPANGFRAMRAAVPLSLTLEEEQYQASELLVGTILAGYRVTERPITMYPRSSGKSKKGNNILYGFRFARVILRTWLRARHESSTQSPHPLKELPNRTDQED